MSSSWQANLVHRPVRDRTESVASRVLLVEDDPVDARVMQQALRKLGFAPMTVSTLKQARACLAEDWFALVVLDLNLPDTAAGDALLAIESVAARIPVIVVSGATAVLEQLRRHRDKRWHLLDKNDLDLGMLAAVTRLAVTGGRSVGGASSAA